MKPVAVLSADHTKARFFILQPAERPKEQWSPILQPLEELINAHWLDQEKESLTGGNKISYHVGLSGYAHTMHGFDDHLSAHQQEINRRFSREIQTKLNHFLSENKIKRLVIAADRKILGCLREQLRDNLSKKLNLDEVEEVAVNLCNLGPVAVHEHLAKLGVLPGRSSPSSPQQEQFARSGQWRRRSAPAEGRDREFGASGHEEGEQPHS
ncbi:hypothetical protein EBU99_13595 [bacterium]|nr:hypothetical protein [bacterium]